eukprot:CAMPEP_0182568024 /NCGR_PEP_ID=MMETSP1324-20130603/9087_1 /TAXON_ID=236786 /ORGANISM="Florenciella sp., Strain RCC1587" /LENGTH=67 /DNA_ID=CAMNT_0024782119 /DNA_START=632 /DNA_END=832 /DNA_ORIENTATION=-
MVAHGTTSGESPQSMDRWIPIDKGKSYQLYSALQRPPTSPPTPQVGFGFIIVARVLYVQSATVLGGT